MGSGLEMQDFTIASVLFQDLTPNLLIFPMEAFIFIIKGAENENKQNDLPSWRTLNVVVADRLW